jgi:hypothetical protein
MELWWEVDNVMVSLESFEIFGLQITWKLINIGFCGSEHFRGELDANEIIDFALRRMDYAQKPDIAALAYECSTDAYAINGHLEKLSSQENSDYDIEFRKWRVLYIINNLPSEDEQCVAGLIELGNIWCKFDFPDDSPHIYQGRGNKITPGQYYTEENYRTLLKKHVDWIKLEIEFLHDLPRGVLKL